MTPILAVDAATRVAGYALLECKDDTVILVAAGNLKLKSEDLAIRLSQLRAEIVGLLDLHRPTYVAVEDCKMNKFAPNFSSLGKVFMSIGVVLEAFASANYLPASITATTVRSRIMAKKKPDTRVIVNKRFAADLRRLGFAKLLLTAHGDIADAIALGWVVLSDETLLKTRIENE